MNYEENSNKFVSKVKNGQLIIVFNDNRLHFVKLNRHRDRRDYFNIEITTHFSFNE